MSFSKEKLTIMIRKNAILIIPSIKLNPTVGRTGCRYPRTDCHWRLSHEAELSPRAVTLVPGCGGDWVDVAAGVLAQPTAMKIAFVNSNGAATNNRMLKIIAKTIELAAAAVAP